MANDKASLHDIARVVDVEHANQSRENVKEVLHPVDVATAGVFVQLSSLVTINKTENCLAQVVGFGLRLNQPLGDSSRLKGIGDPYSESARALPTAAAIVEPDVQLPQEFRDCGNSLSP